MSTPPDDFDWLEALLRKQQASNLAFCRKQMRNEHDAQDAYQEMVVIALLRRDKLWACEPQQRGGWLTETARHVCQNRRRDRSKGMARRRSADEPAPVGKEEAARWRRAEAEALVVPKDEAFWRLQEQRSADLDDTADLLRELAELLRQLPPSLRVVAECSLEGRRPKEIATQLGLTETAVNLRLHRARKQLSARRRARHHEDGSRP